MLGGQPTVEVAVADTGTGMTPEAVQHATDASSPPRRWGTVPGSGYGWSIASRPTPVARSRSRRPWGRAPPCGSFCPAPEKRSIGAGCPPGNDVRHMLSVVAVIVTWVTTALYTNGQRWPVLETGYALKNRFAG